MAEEKVVYVDPDLEELIPDFMENRRHDVVVIGQLLQEGDIDEIKRLGHSMKGSGGGYGFHEITEIGKVIEEAAASGDTGEIERMNSYLSDYLSAVKIVLQEEE